MSIPGVFEIFNANPNYLIISTDFAGPFLQLFGARQIESQRWILPELPLDPTTPFGKWVQTFTRLVSASTMGGSREYTPGYAPKVHLTSIELKLLLSMIDLDAVIDLPTEITEANVALFRSLRPLRTLIVQYLRLRDGILDNGDVVIIPWIPSGCHPLNITITDGTTLYPLDLDFEEDEPVRVSIPRRFTVPSPFPIPYFNQILAGCARVMEENIPSVTPAFSDPSFRYTVSGSTLRCTVRGIPFTIQVTHLRDPEYNPAEVLDRDDVYYYPETSSSLRVLVN